MVHGPFSQKDASPSLGNVFTRHGARPLFAGGRVLLARERVPRRGGRPLFAGGRVLLARERVPRRGGRPLLAGGRVPLARERVHPAWWTVALRWRTRPPRSGTCSPGVVDGRFSLEDASPSPGKRAPHAWCEDLPRSGMHPFRSARRSPRRVERSPVAGSALASLGRSVASRRDGSTARCDQATDHTVRAMRAPIAPPGNPRR
jgi:hypothetical protein